MANRGKHTERADADAMHNQLKQLQDVFLRSAFVVPDYQRGYAWSDQHRGDLLMDLRDLDALAADRMHYTGTLVLHRGRHAPRQVLGKAIDVLDVVDGQQRLTTLVILLSVIARRFASFQSEEATERAKNVRETFVAYRDAHKLTPNGGAETFFRDHVLGEGPNPVPASPPERALLDARSQFDKFVDDQLARCTGDQAKLAWLDRWTALISTRLGFVVFEVQDEADVGVMFEAMNARGKPLTQSELVKNYLLYAAAKVAKGDALRGITADVNDTWGKIVRTLDSAKLSNEDDTFLRYHWWIWPSAKGLDGEALAKTHNIHRAIKSTIQVGDGEETVSANVRAYLSDARTAAAAFADLWNPRHGKAFAFAAQQADPLVERAFALRRLGRSAVVTPLLMAAALRFGGDPVSLGEILRLAETFVFRLSLREARANTGEPTMMKLAFDVRASSMSAAAVQQRLRETIGYYAPDKDVERSLLEPDGSSADGDFYSWPHLPHLLFEYERSLVASAKQKFAHDWESFFRRWRESIEHILPQGENTCAIPYWSARFTEEAWRRSRHRLGNLTLTEWNSTYGNRGFDQKRGSAESPSDARVYRNSRFYCERELAAASEWNEAAIEERQKRLAKFAMDRWKI
jgi:hypothetical protein